MPEHCKKRPQWDFQDYLIHNFLISRWDRLELINRVPITIYIVWNTTFLYLYSIFNFYYIILNLNILLITVFSVEFIVSLLNIGKKERFIFLISYFLIIIAIIEVSISNLFFKIFSDSFSYWFKVTLILLAHSLLIFYSIFLFIKKKLWKNFFDILIISGFCIMILGGDLEKGIPFLTSNFSLILISGILFAFALAVKFNQEHKDLIDLKNTLEQKVGDRTSELSNLNKEISLQKESLEKTNIELSQSKKKQEDDFLKYI